jgi:flagellar biosynthetic protein FlhB
LLLDKLGRALLPLLGLLVVAGVLASTLQFGFLFVPGRIAPDGGRVSLARGLERMFSLSGGMRLGFGLLKLVVIVGVAALVAWNGWADVAHASALDTPQLARLFADTLLNTAWWIGVGLLALALADYGFQRWRHEQELRMTHQEFREEMRNQERDPQIDARRRQLHEQARVDRVGG